jgi:hypothetical protein
VGPGLSDDCQGVKAEEAYLWPILEAVRETSVALVADVVKEVEVMRYEGGKRMLTLSPQVGELLLQATQSQDLEEALHKVLRDYLDLKLASLTAEISCLEEKWGCSFAEFQERTKEQYTYEVERTFWEWERLETLRSHYESLRTRWN